MIVAKDKALDGLPRYQYKPLEEETSIRILEILPGPKGSRVNCRLRNVTLPEAGKYKALSYVWGISFVHVNCIGNTGHSLGHVAITQNLHDLLQHLQSNTDSVFLWADAICINQEDDRERGHQVKQMRNIYATAEQVIVWLGDKDSETEIALEAIADIGTHCQHLSLPEVRAMKTMGALAEALNLANLPKLDEESAIAAARLFKRPWFGRVWVIQEVNAGPEVSVKIGNHSVPWNLIGITAHWLREAQWSSAATSEGSEQMRNAVQMWQGRFNSPESAAFLLDEARDYGSTDPRDKVYALLGFPAMQREVPILPIYDGKTMADVYKDVVKIHIRKTGTVEMLCYVEHPPILKDRLGLRDEEVKTWPNLPSWVPNWTEQTYFPTSSLVSSGSYNESLDHSQPPVEVSDTGNLKVQGFIVGTVGAVARCFAWEHIDGVPNIRNPDAILDFWQSMQDSNISGNRTDLRQSLAQAMTGGIDAEYQAVASQANRHQADFAKFLSDTLENRGSMQGTAGNAIQHLRSRVASLISNTQALQGDGGRYLKASYLTTPCRRLFCNAEGIAGLGHSQVLPGDTIAALLGSNMPFLLRQSGRRYQVVGECYMYGLMHGKAFQRVNSEAKHIFELY